MSKLPLLRPLGQITTEMEPLLEEMTDAHELQSQEIIYIILSWLEVHRPDSIPTYEDGSHPILKYSPSDIYIDD